MTTICHSSILAYFDRAIYPVRVYHMCLDLGLLVDDAKAAINHLVQSGDIVKIDKGYILKSRYTPPPTPKLKPKPPKPKPEPKPKAPKQTREERAAVVREYDKRRRPPRDLLLGENESNKLAKRPKNPIPIGGDIMCDDDLVYFQLSKRVSSQGGAYTCMRIDELEALLKKVKELKNDI